MVKGFIIEIGEFGFLIRVLGFGLVFRDFINCYGL